MLLDNTTHIGQVFWILIHKSQWKTMLPLDSTTYIGISRKIDVYDSVDCISLMGYAHGVIELIQAIAQAGWTMLLEPLIFETSLWFFIHSDKSLLTLNTRVSSHNFYIWLVFKFKPATMWRNFNIVLVCSLFLFMIFFYPFTFWCNTNSQLWFS